LCVSLIISTTTPRTDCSWQVFFVT
jgi:hypothetical protein